MTKSEFLKELNAALSPLQRQERARSVAYYDEMICDRLEDGESEDKIMSELESVDVIARRIISDAETRGALRPKAQPLSTALIIIGSPVWLTLVIVLGAVILCIYIVAWCLIIAMFAVLAAMAAGALAGVAGLILCAAASWPTALLMLGGGFVCAGLGMLIIFPVFWATKSLAVGTGKACAGLWRASIGKLRGKI